jgi:hypothetical protein
MELILKCFLSKNLLYLKFGEKGHLNNILWRIRFKTLEKTLKCKMPWMHDEIFNLEKSGSLHLCNCISCYIHYSCIWCWFMWVRGSYEPILCAFAFKSKIKLCILLGGAQLHFMNFCELIYISCKFMCCHQTPKRGRLKEHFPSKWYFGVCCQHSSY